MFRKLQLKEILKKSGSIAPSVVICFLWLTAGANLSVWAQETELFEAPETYRVEGVPPIKKSEVEHLFYAPSEIKSNLIWDVDGVNNRMLVTDETNQLHLLSAPLSEPVKLLEKIIPASVKFSPTGESFAYNSDHEDEDNFNLFVYDFKEKSSKKLLALTGRDESVESFVWSKNGEALFYTRADYGLKSTKLCRHDLSAERCFELDLKGIWNVLDADGNKVALKYWKASSSQFLYLYDLETGKLMPIDEKGNSRRSFIVGNRIYWTSDGSENCQKNPCILTLDFKTGEKPEQIQLPDNLASISDIKVSPRGRRLLIHGTIDGVDFVRIFPLKGNRLGREVPPFINGSYVIWATRWLTDHEVVYTLENVGKPASIQTYNIDSGKITNWTRERLPKQLENKVMPPEMFKWKSFDQKEISGYIVRPPKSEKRTPVLIFVHGGPPVLDKPIFNTQDMRLIANLGIAIIHTNIRGSSGFGKQYMDADNAEKRGHAVKDIQSLLDWIRRQPDLDADQIYLRGESYGGFIALAAALGEPQRIKGVIAEYPLVSIRGLLSQSWADEAVRNEYGDPKDENLMKTLDALSPLNNAQRWNKIPLFLTRGRNDARVPERDVIDLKNQLQKTGTNVWFIFSTDSGHGFSGKYVQAAMYLFLKNQIKKENVK